MKSVHGYHAADLRLIYNASEKFCRSRSASFDWVMKGEVIWPCMHHNDGPSAGVETLVTITFEERDGKTVQTFHHLNVEGRDSHVGGWSEAFDKLEAYAAKIAKEHIA